MKKKAIGIVVLLLVFVFMVNFLYAQNGAILRQGVYRSNIVSGAAAIYLYGNNNNVRVYDPDGTLVVQGRYRISGNRVSVDYGSVGFETWTIYDYETFKDDKTNSTWVWVRNNY